MPRALPGDAGQPRSPLDSPPRAAPAPRPPGRTVVQEVAGGPVRYLGVAGDVVHLTGGRVGAFVEVTGYAIDRLSPLERARPARAYDQVWGRLMFPVHVYVPPLRSGRDDATSPGIAERLARRVQALLGGYSTTTPVVRHRFLLVIQAPSAEELGERCVTLDRVLCWAGLSSRRLAGEELRRLASGMDWSSKLAGDAVGDGFSTVTAQSVEPAGAGASPGLADAARRGSLTARSEPAGLPPGRRESGSAAPKGRTLPPPGRR